MALHRFGILLHLACIELRVLGVTSCRVRRGRLLPLGLLRAVANRCLPILLSLADVHSGRGEVLGWLPLLDVEVGIAEEARGVLAVPHAGRRLRLARYDVARHHVTRHPAHHGFPGSLTHRPIPGDIHAPTTKQYRPTIRSARGVLAVPHTGRRLRLARYDVARHHVTRHPAHHGFPGSLTHRPIPGDIHAQTKRRYRPPIGVAPADLPQLALQPLRHLARGWIVREREIPLASSLLEGLIKEGV